MTDLRNNLLQIRVVIHFIINEIVEICFDCNVVDVALIRKCIKNYSQVAHSGRYLRKLCVSFS